MSEEDRQLGIVLLGAHIPWDAGAKSRAMLPKGSTMVESKPTLILPGTTWDEQREATPADVKRSKFTLHDLSGEWHFFNHGAFFTYAEFDYPQQDPLTDWWAQQDPRPLLILQPFRAKVFDGLFAPTHLGNLTWDNIVCAVEKIHWQNMFEFLGGVLAMNSKTRRYYRPFAGDVKVPDPVMAERHSIIRFPDLPQIEVTVFGMDGNMARWEPQPTHVPSIPPKIVQRPPRPQVIAEAMAVMGGSLTPEMQGATLDLQNPAFQSHIEEYKRVLREGPKIIRNENDENRGRPPHGR